MSFSSTKCIIAYEYVIFFKTSLRYKLIRPWTEIKFKLVVQLKCLMKMKNANCSPCIYGFEWRNSLVYLFSVWLISEQSSIAVLQISCGFVVLRNTFDVINWCAEELIFQKTRICETVTSGFSTFALFLWLRWIFIWSLKERKACFPTVVISVHIILMLRIWTF